MTNKDPDAIDRWLRTGLDDESEARGRVVRRALASSTRRPGMRGGRIALFGAAALIVTITAAIWTRSSGSLPADHEPVRIANFGQLVSVVDPAGEVWLHAPPGPVDDGSPRLIITLGERDDE